MEPTETREAPASVKLEFNADWNAEYEEEEVEANRTEEPRAAADARDAENKLDDDFKALADSLENILENTLW